MRDLFEIAADRYPDEMEDGLTRFIAARLERRPRMRIHRFAAAYGKDKTFVFDESLGWATAKPPPPFAGSASFLRTDMGSAWIGKLSVELPGAGTIRLAGSDYRSRLHWGEPEDSPGY